MNGKQLELFRRHEGDDLEEAFRPQEKSVWRFVPYAVVAIVIVMLFSTSNVFSQEHVHQYPITGEEVSPPLNPEGYRDQAAHARYHQLYQKMHNVQGTHCCNAGEDGGDCRPTTARWNETKSLWEAKLDGRWIDILPSRHVRDAYGLNEFATVCADETGYLFCFVPPNSGF